MHRTYVRKNLRALWTKENLQKAKTDIRSGQFEQLVIDIMSLFVLLWEE